MTENNSPAAVDKKATGDNQQNNQLNDRHSPDTKEKKWEVLHSLLLALVIVIFIALQIRYDITINPIITWCLLMVVFSVFLAIVGHGITGYLKGVFVDNCNVISLSRFQMAAWTVLVLSAFLTAALWNILHSPTDTPLNITLPETLWLLMGISTTSLVASPLILDGKKNLQPNKDEQEKTFTLLKSQGNDKCSNQGQVVINKSIEQARWTDMFTGEETGNAAHLDLSRVQMFFFTIVSLLAYGVAIGHKFTAVSSATPITDFPSLSEGIIALIGISHTGYLAAKAAPQSQQKEQQAQ